MPLTLPGTGVGSFDWWTSQIGWAREARTDLKADRRYLVNAYRGKLTPPRPEAVRVNIEFEKTEQKRHQLFWRVPALRLKPHPRTLRDAQAQDPNQPPRDLKKAVRIFREVLQRQAGKLGMDTKSLMDQILADVLVPAGLGACKVGYERYEGAPIMVATGAKIPDPKWTPPPGTVLGLHPAPLIDETAPAPNVLSEKYYAARISPGHVLIPPYFIGRNYAREADWLGGDFWLPVHEAKRRKWRISAKATTFDLDDDDRLVELDKKGTREDQLRCTEVWCYAQRVYGTSGLLSPHPDLIRRLVFVEGEEEPVLVEDGRDQRFDQRGRLVQGIHTLPIKVLTLRYVPDFWCPPSDCDVTRRLSDELAEGRTQMVLHRKRAVPLRQININAIIDERVKTLIKNGEWLADIPAESNEPIIQELAPANYPPDRYRFNDQTMNDVDRAWSLGANQAGIANPRATTATEVSTVAQAVQNRLSGEQAAVADFWLDIIEHTANLIQLYADREDFMEIVGEDGARAIEAWDRTTVRGDFLYEVVPDSQAKPDAAAERDTALNLYNLVANDPNINREQVLRDVVEAYGGDPDRLVNQPQPPPPPPPEKPRISVSIKGEDLIPTMPQYANVMALIQAGGIEAQMVPPQQAEEEPVKPAKVVDRERLRMAEADNVDQRAGGLVGAPR